MRLLRGTLIFLRTNDILPKEFIDKQLTEIGGNNKQSNKVESSFYQSGFIWTPGNFIWNSYFDVEWFNLETNSCSSGYLHHTETSPEWEKKKECTNHGCWMYRMDQWYVDLLMEININFQLLSWGLVE